MEGKRREGGDARRPAREIPGPGDMSSQRHQYPVFWVSFLLAISSLAGSG